MNKSILKGVGITIATIGIVTNILLASNNNRRDKENLETNDIVITTTSQKTSTEAETECKTKKEVINWVDFNVSYEALEISYKYDVESYNQDVKLNWIELLAYASAKNWGQFSREQGIQDSMLELVEKLQSYSATIGELTADLEYYNYYYETYSAVLGGLLGEFELDGIKQYGLKGYSPVAKEFYYSDYNDFGVSRTYGYERRHLGHDMMGQTGTPIIAVESGYVEALGWNQYGGWRIGIRSFDKKRYYYYAHLRKDFPFCQALKEGSVVTAGDVIGYMGRTGYSANENVNNIDTTHLHFGIQLIFDESQKEGTNEIWINPYNLIRFLYRNKSQTVKSESTKEWVRVNAMIDPAVQEYVDSNGG